jgi:hypothetical protein
MSQNDYTIANQTTPLFRADLNSALQALASNSSGATAPATTYANMFWYDTAANTLYMRSEADDVWIRIGVLNQSTSKFEVEDYLGFTPVQQGGGVGQLGNKIFIGWSGSELLAQVDDNSSFGGLAFKSDIPAGYTDAQARSAQAGHGLGGVGSYALAKTSAGSPGEGATIAGSSLRLTNVDSVLTGSSLSGTWRVMCGTISYSQAGIVLRIS